MAEPSSPRSDIGPAHAQVSFPLAGPVGQGKVLDVDDIKEAPWVTVTEQQVLSINDPP